MLKRGLLFLATSAMLTFGADSRNIAFNAPVKWATYRNNAIQVQFVTDSTLYDKEISLTMNAVDGTKKKVLARKKVKISSVGNKVDFSALKKSKSLHYSLDWTIKGTDAEGSVAPFAVATLPQSVISEEINLENVSRTLTVDELLNGLTSKVKKVGSSEVALLSTKKALGIIIKKSDTPVTLAFDPANSKDGFITFAHRFVVVGKDSTSFIYKRKSFKEGIVTYEDKQWFGDLATKSNDDYIAVVIPWGELGVKYKSGRRLGFALLSESGSYPAKAALKLPATWNNIKIK